MMNIYDSVRREALRLFGVRLSDGFGILGVTLVDQTGAPVTISGGGGGGGGAVTVADGADVTQGLKADAAATDSTSSWTVVSLLKGLWNRLPGLGAKATTASMPVNVATDDAQFGAEATGFVASAGATGVRGRLSEISTAIRALVLGSAPVTDQTGTATITVVNGNGSAGAATAGSALTLSGLNAANTLGFQLVGTFSGTIGVQTSIDGTNWVNMTFFAQSSTSNSVSMTGTSAQGIFWTSVPPSAQVRIVATAWTSGSVVVTARMTANSLSPNIVAQNVTANLTQIASSTMLASPSAGGASGSSLVASIASSTVQTAYSAVSVVTSAKTGLSTITETSGIGTVCSFFVNLTAFTAGTSTGLDLFLQWSPDGGTNWVDLYQVEAFTAAGTATIPALYIPGRWRFAYQNRSGAASLATLTITATRLNMPVGMLYQFFDYTAALLAGTAGNGASYFVPGAKNVSAVITASAFTSSTSYTLQVSADGVNWATAQKSDGTAATIAVTAVGSFLVTAVNVSARWARIIVSTAGTVTVTKVALTAS